MAMDMIKMTILFMEFLYCFKSF